MLLLALAAMNGVVVGLQIWTKRRRARGDEGETPFAGQGAGWGHRT
jgi:hypothetical protein